MSIRSIHARSIYDSRGKPTVEVDVITTRGLFRASVPSGVSSSVMDEALEVRDGGTHFMGKGVSTALYNVNRRIGPELMASKINVTDQRAIDSLLIELDGTENKVKFGVNAIAGVSMAICKAGAAHKDVPLYRHIADLMGFTKSNPLFVPLPVFNFVSGGIQSWNHLPMQEILVTPRKATDIHEAMRIGTEMYAVMKSRVLEQYGASAAGVGDQGAFTPDMLTSMEALDFLSRIAKEAGHYDKVTFGIDANASEFYRHGKYDLQFKLPTDNVTSSSDNHQHHHRVKPRDLAFRYKQLVESYPLDIIEDPFYYEDMESFTMLNKMLPKRCCVYGDNLTLTSTRHIQRAVDNKACSGVVIKLNQVGTVKETIDACLKAHTHGLNIMVAHRSAETEETFIADLAVGVGACRLKAGAPCRTDRLAKYNQLLRIDEELRYLDEHPV